MKAPTYAELKPTRSFCPIPTALGWDSVNYPVVPSYRDLGNEVRKGSAGWSPFEQASYLACRNGPQIYVHMGGNDSTGSGTAAAPYRTPGKAVQVANAGGVACTIRMASGTWPRTGTGALFATVPTVPVCFLATGGKVTFGSYDLGYTWAADATYGWIYSTARSGVCSVYNPSIRDGFGNATMYRQVSTAAECSRVAGSYYTDNATVWVHAHNGAAPSDLNTLVIVNVSTADCNFAANPQDLFIDGETAADGWDFQGTRVKVFASAYGAADKTIAMRRVANRYAGFANSDMHNSFGFDNWRGLIWLEDCYAARPASDCFNVHNNLGTQQTYLVTLNCRGVDAGVFGAGSNNGLTTHSNVISIDIAGDYGYCQGGTLRNIGTTRMLGHGSRYANDRGDLYVSGGLVYPTEVGMLNTAQIWLSECVVQTSAPTHCAVNVPSGTAFRYRNMPALQGQVMGTGIFEAWAA